MKSILQNYHSPRLSAVLKGRGTARNPLNRFSDKTTELADDGWWQAPSEPQQMAAMETILIKEQSRSIITRNSSPDIPFEQSINPYRGCEHGCIYCYARPSHAYWDLSPGLDFETRIIFKPNAAKLLRKAFDRPGYRPATISIGANTDPYQPAEKQLEITRQLLEVCLEYQHPVSLITKSALIVRDIDLIRELAAANLCSVAVSVTTLTNEIKRKLEPRTASPSARLRVISELAAANVRVTMMFAPVIPAINDHELEDVVAAGRAAGAKTARYILLRLPREVSELFRDWLLQHYPDRASKVLSIIQDTRGGKDYDSGFHQRFKGQGVYASLLRRRFEIALNKAGFVDGERHGLDTGKFQRPTPQLGLF